MLEIVAVFSEGAVNDSETMGGLFAVLDELEGLGLSRYDLNHMEHWRTWEPERAMIDGLTQRTQVIRAEGQGNFFFALGKHGEIPMAAIRADASLESIDIKRWFGLERLMQLRISDAQWRSDHAGLPQVWAWRAAPAGVPTRAEGAAQVCRVADLSAEQQKRLREEP